MSWGSSRDERSDERRGCSDVRCNEFWRRTRTQASFSTEEAAVTLLYGLVAFGQIQMCRIAGYEHVAELLAPAQESAA